MRVFAGGSKTLKALPEAMMDKLVELMGQDAEIVVGDCKGADELIQRHMRQGRYEFVTVYAVEGKERCNLGNWDVKAIFCPWRKRCFGRYNNYAYYLEKDRAMALDADCAVMIWDRRSRGTFLNILNMVALGKPTRVVLQDGSAEYDIASFEDVHELLPARWPLHVPTDSPLTRTIDDKNGAVHDYAATLREFLPSRDMRAYLEENPLSKRDLINVVLGSPRSLEAKLAFFDAYSDTDDVFHEVIDEVATRLEANPSRDAADRVREPGFAWFDVQYASCSTHRNMIEKALNALRSSGPNELVYRKAFWDEQPVLYEEHEAGIAPFHTFDEALEDLRFEMEADETENSAADDNSWTVFEKWRRAPDGKWKNPYTFYALGDEVVFFDEMRYNEEGRYWEVADGTYGGDFTGKLNVRTPFKTGDIVTLDCRPFAPLRHGLILLPERDETVDCCFPRALVRCGKCGAEPHEDRWCDLSVKHGGGLHISMPGYSPLYRMEVWEGELPEDEQVLLEVRKWLDGDRERGEALAEAVSRSEVGAGNLRELIRLL